MKFFLILVLFACFSCERQVQKRHYTEIVSKPPELPAATVDPHAGLPGFEKFPPGSINNPQMPQESVASGGAIDLGWDLPDGWSQEPAGGLRLATFTAEGKEGVIECSLVSLAGSAGGLEENIRRWLGQVDLKEMTDSGLAEFITKQEKITTPDQLQTTIIDLTQLQSEKENSHPSIIAAIVALADKTIFIKMTGSRSALIENRQKFKAICQSLRKK